MACRRELKNVANGLLSSFNSRNNDLYGYWGIGMLFLYAKQLNNSTFTIDLLNKKIFPLQPSTIPLINFYGQMLKDKLDNRAIPLTWLKSASLSITFNAEYDEKYHYFRSALGTPYVCSLCITDDHDKTREAKNGGICRPHDPKKELRSARAKGFD